MKVWKIILISLGIMLMVGYLVWSVVYLHLHRQTDVCKKVAVHLHISNDGQCLTEDDILRFLNRERLNPIGKTGSDVLLGKIEATIAKLPAIRHVSCYRTTAGDVAIEITPRTPVFKVMTGNNYLVDTERCIMPVSTSCPTWLPVVSGAVTKQMATHELYDFIVFLQKDRFLAAQIEQIYLLSNGDVELTPRVGNHIIRLGRLDDYADKLDKLKIFYTKALNKIGWNRYAIIDLRYNGQVVCTKR
ncbi:MAG: cell division protein FtsQ/DivIB [Prevotellaceae bacterium]|jgi:cell division protein FtsQ|nr:cell division protein FtsQ/DivIB [Prevotellaceae bacterium]